MCAADAEKNELKAWLKKQWCIAPEANAEFVCKMEEVLEVYQRPYDRKRPLVCMDETSKQLAGETRVPVAAAAGRPTRYDYEYVRNGTANVFLFCEPLAGKRQVRITARRTKVDWAHRVRELVDRLYPRAEKIVLVLDNLNTHDTRAGVAVRGLHAGGSQTHRRSAGDSLHAQARKLAEHGGNRIRNARPSMLGSPHRRRGHARTRGRSVGDHKKCDEGEDRLALHHRRRPNQTEKTVSDDSGGTEH